MAAETKNRTSCREKSGKQGDAGKSGVIREKGRTGFTIQAPGKKPDMGIAGTVMATGRLAGENDILFSFPLNFIFP